MDSAFVQSILYSPPEILGKQLMPYCAGHEFLLCSIGSPLVDGGQVSRDDIATGLFICSMTFEGGVEAIREKSYLRDVLEWGAAAGPWDGEDVYLEWIDYRGTYTQFPQVWSKVGTAAGSGAPGAWATVVSLIIATKGAFTESQAWNMPLCKAVCYIETANDLHTKERLMSDTEREAISADQS